MFDHGVSTMRLLKIMTMNIGNPSLQRAQKQIEWIENREEDIYILTETKVSAGCNYLAEYFGEKSLTLFDHGEKPFFYTSFPKSQTGDLGVMILSRFPIVSENTCFDKNNPFFSRLSDIIIDCHGKKIGIMGLYVPSRDATQEKIIRKKEFIIQFLQHLKRVSSDRPIPYIIGGDLNILERGHVPRYRNFLNWEYDFYDRFDHFGFDDAFRLIHPSENEYSWVGRSNDGYRYDHLFVSKDLSKCVKSCEYVHETRRIRITDHSAMVANLML